MVNHSVLLILSATPAAFAISHLASIYKPRRPFWKGNEEPESIGGCTNKLTISLPT